VAGDVVEGPRAQSASNWFFRPKGRCRELEVSEVALFADGHGEGERKQSVKTSLHQPLVTRSRLLVRRPNIIAGVI
jgi:hypothetical protein